MPKKIKSVIGGKGGAAPKIPPIGGKRPSAPAMTRKPFKPTKARGA